MSGADLFEDGFPHGTKEGYERGCRGHGSCPGQLEFGRTCAQAQMNYAGDFTYKKRVDAGMSPAEIAELERADGVKPAKAPVKTTDISQATVTVADSVEPLGDLAESENLSGIALEKHGTKQGYGAGCRLKDACPGVERVGMSCTQAVAAYQRELNERKAAARAAERSQGPSTVEIVEMGPPVTEAEKAVAQRPQEAVEVPVEAEPAEAEIVREAVEEPATEPVPAAPVPRAPRGVRAEGLLTDLAAAKEQVALLEAQLLQARIDLAEVTRQRDSQHEQLSALREEHAVLNQRLHDEHAESSRRIEELEEQLAGMQEHFDIQEQRIRAKAEVETTSPIVATTAAPAHGASLQVRQMGDAFAFDISGGGEAVRLELAFEAGQLQRAAVTTGN